ncbi:hypothetical protein CRG98_038912 [Punica granatum]|uniref:Uncharacterized protein n=1 Tax=Punica granatum TaxID=22663 RepID=A0A2I0I9I8_PUNGR|nr:hypothetical protein CRG98_038912 [Punica granatum]
MVLAISITAIVIEDEPPTLNSMHTLSLGRVDPDVEGLPLSIDNPIGVATKPEVADDMNCGASGHRCASIA